MSTLKVDTIATRTGSGNITLSNSLASATVAGDLTVDTSLLKVDSTNDRIGIGTASPTQATLHVAGGGVPARFESTSASTTYVQFGASGTSNYGQVAMNGNDMTLRTAYTDRMKIDGSGNIMAPAITLGNGTTYAAANTIDDYEEGTWTASLIGSTSSPSTPINVTSNYTKIGNVVHAYCVFSNVNTTGASGAIRVTGLPYASNGNCVNSGCMLYSRFSVPADGFVHPYVASTLTQIRFYYSKSGAAWGETSHSAGTACYVWAGVTYQTAS